MIFWIDAHLSPRFAQWLSESLEVDAYSLRDLGLRDSSDEEIFLAGAKARAVIISKDSDFVDLLERHGSPPQLIWLTCGNTSNMALQRIFASQFNEAIRLLGEGERLIEIR